MNTENAVLVLEDGTAFDGTAFGTRGEATGETVFYTGVVGYQEILTDPSYRGTLLVCTYPIIGSYGVNAEDNESPAAQANGIIVKEYSAYYNNFRAEGDLESFLTEHGVVGIQGVDTRALTVHLRDHGEMKGIIASGDVDRKALGKKLKSTPSPFEGDLLGDLSAVDPPKPESQTRKVAVLNLGLKRSLLGQLAELGYAVDILPAAIDADEVLSKKPDGLILAGGPGDPSVPTYAVESVKALLGKLPILGIGLGHQVLALGLGCTTKRMTAGHRGVNYPVRDLVNDCCHITAQNHSFIVDAESVPDSVEVTHVNVNDQTVEGIRSKEHNASSVQFHPSPDEMGRPNALLEEFLAGK